MHAPPPRQAIRDRDVHRETGVGAVCAIVGSVVASQFGEPAVAIYKVGQGASAFDAVHRQDLLVLIGWVVGVIGGSVAWIVLVERRLPWPLGHHVGKGSMGFGSMVLPTLAAILVGSVMLAAPAHVIATDPSDPASLEAFVRLPQDAAQALVGLWAAFAIVALATTLLTHAIRRAVGTSRSPKGRAGIAS